jgi:hypothetical protein
VGRGDVATGRLAAALGSDGEALALIDSAKALSKGFRWHQAVCPIIRPRSRISPPKHSSSRPRFRACLTELTPLSGLVGKSYAPKWSLSLVLREFVLNFCATNPELKGASCCFLRTFKKSVKTYCGFKSWPLEFVENSVLTTTCCG